MEIVYLEVFHKQGIVGLSFWGLVILLNWLLYRRAVKNNNFQRAAPFLLSVVLVYLQSLTNPYLNNPIGLTMISVSLVCLNLLGNKKV
jgi:O-antigen ligase